MFLQDDDGKKKKMENLVVREVRMEDKEDLDVISRGIYSLERNGVNYPMDYLMPSFDRWMEDPSRQMLGLYLVEKLIGFYSFHMIDGGNTRWAEAVRIGEDYRFNFSSRISYPK